MKKGKVDALLGIVFGDEGKGKVVDVFTPEYDVVARFAGGPNAGHTIIFEGQKFVLRSIPSGIFAKDKVNIIGNGCVTAPDLFMAEAKELEAAGYDLKERLHISKRAPPDPADPPCPGPCLRSRQRQGQSGHHRQRNRPHLQRQSRTHRLARG